MFSYLYLLFFLDHYLHALRNPFSRSESIQMKERCGQSILLKNHFWLFKQTHQALEAIENKQITFASLPWQRLSTAIEGIFRVCSIDHLQSSQERIHQHQVAVQAGTFLAKKIKSLHPSTIKPNKPNV